MSDSEDKPKSTFDFQDLARNIGDITSKVAEVFGNIDNTDEGTISESFIKSLGDIDDNQREQLEEFTKFVQGVSGSVKKIITDLDEIPQEGLGSPDPKKCPTFQNIMFKDYSECPMKKCPAFEKCDLNTSNIDALVSQHRNIQNQINNLNEEEVREFWGKYYGISSISESIDRIENKIDDILIAGLK